MINRCQLVTKIVFFFFGRETHYGRWTEYLIKINSIKKSDAYIKNG